MAISEELELDITSALDAIESLNEPLTALGENLTITLTGAIEAVDVTPLVEQLAALDASGLTTTIDAAVAEAGGTVPIEADTSSIAPEIDASIDSADTTIPLEADVSDFGGSIDEALAAADTTVPIEADAGEITSEIEASIESADTEVIIEADTAALEEISGESGAATTGLEGVTGASGDLQAAASGNLGAGALGGLTSALGKAGPLGLAGAAGLGVFATGIKTIFDLAVPAIATQQRFNATFGDLAKRANEVNLGKLNTNLSDLAVLLGSDDEALQDAASSLFQFSRAGDIAKEPTLELINNVSALSARAVALNPNLGGVGENVNALAGALARGGKPLNKFGISLNKVDIQARAAANAAKGIGDGISQQSLSLAGAQLAAEKYGGSIKKEITDGSKSAAIEQRRLKVELENVGEEAGKPLVSPIQKFMREILPVVQSLAPVFADLGKETIPVLAQALKDATPTIKAFGELLRLLAPILGPLQKLVNVLVNPIGAIAGEFQKFGDLPDIAGFFSGVGAAIGGFGQALLGIGPALIGGITAALSGVGGALADFGQALIGIGGQLIGGLLSGITTAATAVFEFFVNLPGQVIAVVGDTASTLFETGVTLIGGLLRAVTTAIVEVFSFFSSLPGRIIEVIGDVASTLFNKGLDLIQGLLNGISQKAGEVFQFVSGIPGAILGAIGDVGGLFLDVGRSIIGGLRKGLEELLPNLLTFIKDKIVGAIKRIPFVGRLIGSPSPFFREVGQAINEGLVAGIDDTLGDLQDVGKSMLDALPKTIPGPTFVPATLPIPGVSKLPAVAAALPSAAAAAPTAGSTSGGFFNDRALGSVNIENLIIQTPAKDQTMVGIETAKQLRAESFRAGR